MKVKWIIAILMLAMGHGLLCSTEAQGEGLVGLTREEVMARMDGNVKFRKDKSIVKQQFNYLKYVNDRSTRTFIIYFSPGDICRKTRLVVDYSEIDSVMQDLDNNFSKSGSGLWEYDSNGKKLQVRLEKQEWYFVLEETLKEK
jgi:hypothetical protein